MANLTKKQLQQIIREEITNTKMPDQRSVTDQLKDLIKFANQNGLYDAADWIQSQLK